MDKNQLIDKITPLFNLYKSNKDRKKPVIAIEIMWEIGDLLKEYIDLYKVKPHSLYREIYGKSEGQRNVIQKSYIPREFQGRCYRIRGIFRLRQDIQEKLGSLNSVTAFREAMPFFDNPKYKLSDEQQRELLSLLNGSLKPAVVLKNVRALLNKNIGKKNPRTQRLFELETLKNTFISFYNDVYRRIAINDFEATQRDLGEVDIAYIRSLSRNTGALTEEGLKYFNFEILAGMGIWTDYGEMLHSLISQKDARIRRRFRRIISPTRIVKLADMLYALTDKSAYSNINRRS